MVLISDLIEGGVREKLLKRAAVDHLLRRQPDHASLL